MWSFKFCLKLLRRVVSWRTPRLLSLWCRTTWNPAKPFRWTLRSRTGPRQSRTVSPSVTPRRGSSWRSASGCRGRWWSCRKRTGSWGWVPAWPHSAAALAPLSPLAWALGAGVAWPLPHSLVQPPCPGLTLSAAAAVQSLRGAPVVQGGPPGCA